MLDDNLTNKCCPLPALYSAVYDYASRLRQYAPDDFIIKTYREHYANQFQELCVVHLSFIIDIPWNLIEPKHVIPHHDSHSKSAFKRFLAGCRLNLNPLRPDPVKFDEIPRLLTNNLIALIDRLDNDEACSMEGIFRKAGHTVRKRQLREVIYDTSFDPSTVEWEKYNYHDMASTLKSVLMHLSTPLLTKRLMPLFVQVSALQKGSENTFHPNDARLTHDADDSGMARLQSNGGTPRPSSTRPPATAVITSGLTHSQYMNLINSKQLKALRLLIQLLPLSNLLLFKRLMNLISRVRKLQSRNRMTTEGLGTIFGPVLLPEGFFRENGSVIKNSKAMPIECQERYRKLSSMTSLIFETGHNIFMLPRALVEDIYTNIAEWNHFDQTNSDSPAPFGVANNPNGRTSPISSPFRLDDDRRLGWGKNHECTPVRPAGAKSPYTTTDETPPLRTCIRFVTPHLSTLANTQCGGEQRHRGAGYHPLGPIMMMNATTTPIESNNETDSSSCGSRSPPFHGVLNVDSVDEEDDDCLDCTTTPTLAQIFRNRNLNNNNNNNNNNGSCSNRKVAPNVNNHYPSCLSHRESTNRDLLNRRNPLDFMNQLSSGFLEHVSSPIGRVNMVLPTLPKLGVLPTPVVITTQLPFVTKPRCDSAQNNQPLDQPQWKQQRDEEQEKEYKILRPHLDMDESNSKHKFRRHRRFTELRFPSSINRTHHHRRAFLPCPIVLPPMKRNAHSRFLSP